MKSETLRLITYASYASALFPMVLYFIKYKAFPRENHLIGIFVCVSVLLDTISFYLASKSAANALVGNVYFIAAIIVLSLYYYQVVFQFRSRTYFKAGVALYTLSLLIVSLRQGINVFHGELWALTGLILVVYGIIYNNYQVEKPPLLDKNLYSGLIFNAAIMFYFSFNFFLFLIANYVLTELSAEMARMAWAFHNVNNIIKNIAFAFGLYYTNRRRLNLTDEEVERIQWKNLR